LAVVVDTSVDDGLVVVDITVVVVSSVVVDTAVVCTTVGGAGVTVVC
jgi:hypothetical protein